MNPVVTSAPVLWPITLAEAKAQCRIEPDFTDDDAWFNLAIPAAVSWAQTYCWRSFVSQTRQQALDRWPCDVIPLEYGPVQSITSVTYYDEEGTSATFASSNYYLDTFRDEMVLFDAATWPTTTLRKRAGIVVEYVAGIADDFSADLSANPRSETAQAIRMALLLMIGAWYVNREDEVIGVNVIPTAVMNGARALLGPLVRF